MTTIEQKHNDQLNAIKEALRNMVVSGVIVKAEFVANTNQSKDYLAFVNFYGVKGLGSNSVSHFRGIELEKLGNIEECVKHIIDGVNAENLIPNTVFKCE